MQTDRHKVARANSHFSQLLCKYAQKEIEIPKVAVNFTCKMQMLKMSTYIHFILPFLYFLKKIFTHLYASFSLSSDKISSFVSCLYDRGGNGIGANLRDSSQ